MFTAGPAVLCIGPVALFYVYNNNWKVTVNILPVTALMGQWPNVTSVMYEG